MDYLFQTNLKFSQVGFNSVHLNGNQVAGCNDGKLFVATTVKGNERKAEFCI